MGGRSFGPLVLGAGLLSALSGCATLGEGASGSAGVAPMTQEPPVSESTLHKSFALYVLSRGKGVPDEAWETLGRVRALAETDREKGVAVTIQEKRIGLEGERRLCIEYEERKEARRAYGRAKALVEGVDLARIEIETCAEPDKNEKEKGEEP